jgi:hypothetical protein
MLAPGMMIVNGTLSLYRSQPWFATQEAPTAVILADYPGELPWPRPATEVMPKSS